jgi:hypothetical protein
METEETTPPPRGCLMPIVWAVIAGVTVCGAAAWTGLAGMGSESAGMNAATFSAGPFGFGLAGGLAALIIHFVSRNTGVRVGVPVGCGCLGAIAAVASVGFFFAAIWPSL